MVRVQPRQSSLSLDLNRSRTRQSTLYYSLHPFDHHELCLGDQPPGFPVTVFIPENQRISAYGL